MENGYNKSSGISAILFDLDNTLIATRKADKLACSQVSPSTFYNNIYQANTPQNIGFYVLRVENCVVINRAQAQKTALSLSQSAVF